MPAIFDIFPRHIAVSFLSRSRFAIKIFSSLQISWNSDGKSKTCCLFDSNWHGIVPFTHFYGKFYKCISPRQMRKHAKYLAYFFQMNLLSNYWLDQLERHRRHIWQTFLSLILLQMHVFFLLRSFRMHD